MRASAIVVAAGEGRRMRCGEPKPYVLLAGRPILLRTLDRIFAARTVADVVVVVAPGRIERCRALLQADPAIGGRSWTLAEGGSTRQESVRRGLERIPPDRDIVLIHDGARPLVPPALVDACAEAAYRHGAAVPGVPARDTIKVVTPDGRVQSTLERDALREVQTPQAFRYSLILEGHRRALSEDFQGTDDAVLVERMGEPVVVIEGDRSNIKITLPEDLAVAEALLGPGPKAWDGSEPRSGSRSDSPGGRGSRT
ncbi:MAG TPA: 2-C-methyl-D-erythritol 4-phosphate cytidylyltransferase [candidate division Zixibacteria bacterium]|nr:2-C-methyl-D-erythritol 4-phosphate cytidylyltransferase [candidate division Zixibacteria bacterium]